MKSIVSLTFDINEIDAFQKVIIFEESAALRGKETFGGVQKVLVFKNDHFPEIDQKVFEFPMVLEQKSICIPNGFARFSRNAMFLKTNVFCIPFACFPTHHPQAKRGYFNMLPTEWHVKHCFVCGGDSRGR